MMDENNDVETASESYDDSENILAGKKPRSRERGPDKKPRTYRANSMSNLTQFNQRPEDLAKYLRYIQNNLHENGDKQARILQNKLFESYGCHHSVGGRRTAGLIAAQLLKKLDGISTIFVSSSESRAMYKYSERAVSKFFLIQFSKKQVAALAQREGMTVDDFKFRYLYPAEGYYVGISEAYYTHTLYSKPPEDGKLRKLTPAYNWLKLRDEFLHPKNNALDAKPISYDWIYRSEG